MASFASSALKQINSSLSLSLRTLLTSHSCSTNILVLASSSFPFNQTCAIVANPSNPRTAGSAKFLGEASNVNLYHQSWASKRRAGSSSDHSFSSRKAAAAGISCRMRVQQDPSGGVHCPASPGGVAQISQFTSSSSRMWWRVFGLLMSTLRW